MKKLLLLWVVVGLAAAAFADDRESGKESKAQDRVQAAADVLDEIQAAPDQGIPEEVLGSAECVAVVPSMLKAGFVVGARYGRGVASCRTPKGWSAPAFFLAGAVRAYACRRGTGEPKTISASARRRVRGHLHGEEGTSNNVSREGSTPKPPLISVTGGSRRPIDGSARGKTTPTSVSLGELRRPSTHRELWHALH